jgi:hypothetical protein
MTTRDTARSMTPLDRTRLLHQDPLHFFSLRPRLVGHQGHADDLLRILSCLIRSLGQLDAAAFSPASRVNLGLDDDGRSEFLGDCLCFGWDIRNLPLGNGHSVLGQDGLGLILVDVHTLWLLPE